MSIVIATFPSVQKAYQPEIKDGKEQHDDSRETRLRAYHAGRPQCFCGVPILAVEPCKTQPPCCSWNTLCQWSSERGDSTTPLMLWRCLLQLLRPPEQCHCQMSLNTPPSYSVLCISSTTVWFISGQSERSEPSYFSLVSIESCSQHSWMFGQCSGLCMPYKLQIHGG